MTTETQPLRGPQRKRQSHLWRRDPLDWYVEPEWCSERLFAMEAFGGTVWDPFAGMGRIVVSGERAGLKMVASDIETRGYDWIEFCDFKVVIGAGKCADNIVANPPFALAEPFTKAALEMTMFKVAMLLPANWIQGDKRSRWLEKTPLKRVLFLTPRPSMPPGGVVLQGGKPGNGTTDYAWFIWEHGHQGAPVIGWCRK